MLVFGVYVVGGEEMKREVVEQLQINPDNISKNNTMFPSDCSSADVTENRQGCQHMFVEIEILSNTLSHPIIGVKFPFLLPPTEHDWHCQSHQVLLEDTSRYLSRAERERERC